MYQILEACDYVHSKGIVHKDLKTGNLLYDAKTKNIKMIDWGHSDFYVPGKEYTMSIGTGFYKSPELLVGYKQYAFAVDIWALGCVFAKMTLQLTHFLKIHGYEYERSEQLSIVTSVLGTQPLLDYIDKYNIQLEHGVQWVLQVFYPKKEWSEYIDEDNEKYVSEEALDLLTKTLQIRVAPWIYYSKYLPVDIA